MTNTSKIDPDVFARAEAVECPECGAMFLVDPGKDYDSSRMMLMTICPKCHAKIFLGSPEVDEQTGEEE